MNVTSDDTTKQPFSGNKDTFPTTTTQDAIFRIAYLTVIAILQLPSERIDGNIVPTMIFERKPGLFQAFMLLLLFAFSGSTVSESIKEKQPKIALYCRKLAVFSVAVAMGVFAFSGLLSFYNIEMVDASSVRISSA
ncbi:hypothetical protein RND71_002282 [Anisodus tanguticus]|uniref:Uncharacterized protein n=1 Tax=Anisodus tanguticus TaxID=243964 RepID=A0AAE1T2Q0_9SOLA|nr:hypothetical protein RND71_002282 [Anisodus tanguticus]